MKREGDRRGMKERIGGDALLTQILESALAAPRLCDTPLSIPAHVPD